jgi:hypothetical protein
MGTLTLTASADHGILNHFNMEWRQITIKSSAVDLAIFDYNLPSMRGQTIKIHTELNGDMEIPNNYEDKFLQRAATFFEDGSVLKEDRNATYYGVSLKSFRTGFYPRFRGKNIFGGVHWPAPAEFLLFPLTLVNLIWGVGCWEAAHDVKMLGDAATFGLQFIRIAWQEARNNDDSIYRKDSVAKGLLILGLIFFPVLWLGAQGMYAFSSYFQYIRAILDGVTNLCVSLVAKLTCCLGDKHEYAGIGYCIGVIVKNCIKLAPLALLMTVVTWPGLNAMTQVLDNLMGTNALPFVYAATLGLCQLYGASINLVSSVLTDSFSYLKNKLTKCFYSRKQAEPEPLPENEAVIQPSIQSRLHALGRSSQSNLPATYDVNGVEVEEEREPLASVVSYAHPAHQPEDAGAKQQSNIPLEIYSPYEVQTIAPATPKNSR